MKAQWVVSLLAACGGVAASSSRPGTDQLLRALGHRPLKSGDETQYQAFEKKTIAERSSPPPRFLNKNTQKFSVNGTGIPDVDFDVGESYAGLLPISNKTDEESNLFFWFFPTINEEHKKTKEITIWLNGGPGCSSLLGFLQENGPFMWQPGLLKPKSNPWSWHRLTNVVWIEQPVGVGFSEGNVTITNEDELSEQFKGFWKNFIDTFSMKGWKVYIAAESYGGFYGPYISSSFIDAKDKDYFDLGGLIIYDGIIFDRSLQTNVPILDFVNQHLDIFALDEPTLTELKNVSARCGFTQYVDKYLTFPPAGLQPALTPGEKLLPNGTITGDDECLNLWDWVIDKATIANPCFNIYNILDHCPKIFDPLGSKPYFNRTDVKKAIHVPQTINWETCADKVFNTSDGGDLSPSPGLKQLPHVIDSTQNVILAHGGVDYILVLNGVLLGVQNMTWGGKMGFQTAPKDPFYVPLYGLDPEKSGGWYGADLSASSGVVGTSHHERGLTLAVTALAGHEGPQYSPAAALRHLEKLLGRVHSLSDTQPFTLPEIRNITQLKKPLGKGIVKIPA